MYIKKIILKNFRNYIDNSFSFKKGINYIVGANGIGKTNILEAISILSNIKSFKGCKDKQIINWNSDNYFCSLEFNDFNIDKINIGYSKNNKEKKKITIDNKKIDHISNFYGKFITIILSPNDINIIDGEPEIRRKYFDSVISKIDIDYLKNIIEYKKILKNRNAVLKKYQIKNNKVVKFDELNIWNRLLAEKSSYIIAKRIKFINEFNDIFIHISNVISNNDNLIPKFYYKSYFTENSDYNYILNKIKDNINLDLQYGYSTVGPHRDDFVLKNIDGILFKYYASQGQKRTSAIALKLAEMDIISNIFNRDVVILVDDIFSELDNFRKDNILNLLLSQNQVIITSANSENIGENINIIRINNEI